MTRLGPEQGTTFVALSTASTITVMWTSWGPSGGCIQFTGVHWSNTGHLLVIHWSYTGHILVIYWSYTGQRLIIVCPAHCCLLQARELERDVRKVEVARHEGRQEAGESRLEAGGGNVGAVRRTKRRRMRGNSAREAQKRVPGRLQVGLHLSNSGRF
jgi:hypothetical protein